MKKNFFSVRLLGVAAIGLVAFASCKKNDNNQPQTPVAGLMAFNMVPDKQGVAITLSGNSITNQPLAFTSYTGGYLPIFTGDRQAVVYDALSGNQLSTASTNFAEDKYYSLFAVGYGNYYKSYIAHDGIDSLSGSSGKAYIRYVNGVADSISQSAVKIIQGGTPVLQEAGGLGKIANFAAVNPGEITVELSSSENTGITASRAITVEEKKVYTILLVGVPGSTDDTQKVQIRYVENGTLSADSTSDVSIAQSRVINAQ